MAAGNGRPEGHVPMPPSRSVDLALFWTLAALTSCALGGLEFVSQARALAAVEALCSRAQCGGLASLTAWIVAGQSVVCLVAVVYVLSCVALAPRPGSTCQPALGLLLALLISSLHLVAAIRQFSNGGWMVGREGEGLEAERGEVVLGLCWCLTAVFVLIVLLVCTDQARQVACAEYGVLPARSASFPCILSANTAKASSAPRVINLDRFRLIARTNLKEGTTDCGIQYVPMSHAMKRRTKVQGPNKCILSNKRRLRGIVSCCGAKRELYPIQEVDEEADRKASMVEDWRG